MDFYEILQTILDDKGMSVPDVAKLSGIPDSTLRSILKRKTKTASLEVAMRVSRALNVSLETLNGDAPYIGDNLNLASMNRDKPDLSDTQLLSNVLNHWDWDFTVNDDDTITIHAKEGIIFPVSRLEIEELVSRIGFTVNTQLINKLTKILDNLKESKKPDEDYVMAAHNDNDDPDQYEKMLRDIESLRERARKEGKR